jgi:C1A family cysteine protease
MKKILVFLFCANLVYAADSDYTIVDTRAYHVQKNKAVFKSSYGDTVKDDSVDTKDIKLLEIQLSAKAKSLINQRLRDFSAHNNSLQASSNVLGDLPRSVTLNMNNVPVLDQKSFGTCVTFATTAALDALIGKGDYISQVCNLQLSSYLANHSFINKNYWNGAAIADVLDEIAQYGVVNITKQKSYGCGSLYFYPYFYYPTNSEMSAEDFAKHSEAVLGKYASWSDINVGRRSDKFLLETKNVLAQGDRLVMGFLIPDANLGSAGATAKYKTWLVNDAWVLSSDIIAVYKDKLNSGSRFEGHAIVITGYDDDAVVYDNSGKKHKGIFKLRNSWGNLVGNWGEFYMSYDYFTLFAHDVKRISKA